jgi:hypothetical protein
MADPKDPHRAAQRQQALKQAEATEQLRRLAQQTQDQQRVMAELSAEEARERIGLLKAQRRKAELEEQRASLELEEVRGRRSKAVLELPSSETLPFIVRLVDTLFDCRADPYRWASREDVPRCEAKMLPSMTEQFSNYQGLPATEEVLKQLRALIEVDVFGPLVEAGEVFLIGGKYQCPA